MDKPTLFKLYTKEREYQKCCFGEYSEIKSLNLASFILFIEEYIHRAKKCYSGKWDTISPDWFHSSTEMFEGSAPIDAYMELIKVFALTGAALETFTEIDVNNWRKNIEQDTLKWKQRNFKKGEL